jgi:hypothetical protein
MVTIGNEILCNCGPCSKPTPKLLAIDDFEASRGNEPTTLFLDLAVAVSVYVAFLSRHLISHYAACSHGVPIGARKARASRQPLINIRRPGQAAQQLWVFSRQTLVNYSLSMKERVTFERS